MKLTGDAGMQKYYDHWCKKPAVIQRFFNYYTIFKNSGTFNIFSRTKAGNSLVAD
jgi:hypothetical protein